MGKMIKAKNAAHYVKGASCWVKKKSFPLVHKRFNSRGLGGGRELENKRINK